jgi:predicted nucleic-acid-binding protein
LEFRLIVETEWVLRSRYLLRKAEIAEALSGLLDATEVRFEDEPAVEETLCLWKDSAAGFADCLIGAHNHRLQCRATATFDAKAVKLPAFVVL